MALTSLWSSESRPDSEEAERFPCAESDPRWEQEADWLLSRRAANHTAVLLFRAREKPLR